MGEVDPAFIQDIEHRPKFITGLEAGGIPLIDLSLLTSHQSLEGYSKDLPQAISDLVQEIGSACKDWGFFQVINHGVPSDVRRRVETAAKEFYELPLEEKRKVRRDEINPLGYYDTEHTKNVRDWKEVFDFTVDDPTVIPLTDEPDDPTIREMNNQWPDYPSDLRNNCEEYCRAVERLAFKLLEAISLSLGLPAKRFNEFFKDQTSFVRLNHYPPCPSPELALGVGRHKDAGALTVLSQDDVGGLEVKRKTDGEWIRVKPIPDSYIINVGDIIQVWSNDRYESVEHRVVVNSMRERFSIPFFFNPSHYVVVKPLEELVDKVLLIGGRVDTFTSTTYLIVLALLPTHPIIESVCGHINTFLVAAIMNRPIPRREDEEPPSSSTSYSSSLGIAAVMPMIKAMATARTKNTLINFMVGDQ
ncbi:protein DMR6-LIKE OXYGENASE 1-like [Macadamia integrifolia]|uniref:protein DMR6-LIKE OXYGENASE 1-like n=1 Tax=Macadamia integrifolia TaxID=60698 RepID=UPI001C4FD76B|nr:protein DMR6-LIKE OXYGENASE 1-like [Macadamia integrifolia]